MADSSTPIDNTDTPTAKKEEEVATPLTILSQMKSFEPTWKLPDWQLTEGTDNHLEVYAIKSLLGFTFGVASGLLLFRTNKGRNALAGGLFGLGAATGSFIERVVGDGDPAIPSFDIPDISKWTKKD